MMKPSTVRRYGKQQHKKSKGDRLFAELPQTPNRLATTIRKTAVAATKTNVTIEDITEQVTALDIQNENSISETVQSAEVKTPVVASRRRTTKRPKTPVQVQEPTPEPDEPVNEQQTERQPSTPEPEVDASGLRVLSWPEICPPGDRIVKIAEASYAEVYRVNNERGTSIIKVIRMVSPIKPQTKAQEKSRLVDEQPHSESDLVGELKISEWLADIPGFVMYKERYIVQGKACRELLETHQAFHKRAKRQDPGRLQFYPSPSRYLDDTKFLVVELGDAGVALEDFQLHSADQIWDIFFHVAIALARAEAQIEFEHRDLHEGNLCIRQVGHHTPPEARDTSSYFGHSGLEITILDYGLSRARENPELEDSRPVAYDLERDMSLFTSEHAPQCRVYRQMRSFMLRGDRICLPPNSHKNAYAEGVDGPISWIQHEPYTNVLWLAYIYDYIVSNFQGPKKELNAFKRITKEFWTHLDPEADESIPAFPSASDIVMFAVESGWIDEDQLVGGRSMIEKSILSILAIDDRTRESGVLEAQSPLVRRSPRKSQPRHLVDYS
ncbi:hypothetical protein PFICI_05533 [Pestalotiopsis fici W106-1]|uniref:non-specific serine/threonine protein kinase n=1 Tax=Pestalotiopsis fici (strain W106-1 / CGMCC3.15140) TaxID=1229662 RepID=W3XE06_PESFW|nr:uncharacterized protein PFICI_05533 [Pestalotiopsis fici W106-1]ETS83657.1 hypothetical protein PFICI_05533 [Pestalotiopsis fici W106-1]